MKTYIFLISIICLGISSFGQELGAKEKKANAAFENFSYNRAIEKYEDLEDSNLDLKRNEALSYWKIHKTVQAEALYAEIVKQEGHTKEDVYNYASVLRENKKYEASDEWMVKYAEINTSDSRGLMYVKEKGVYKTLLKDKGVFTINNLDINSEQQDFGPSYFLDLVVFASSREGTKPIRRKWNWTTLPFLDVYVADKENDNNLINASILKGDINKKFHEGPVAFNAAGDKMIFTRNNYDGMSSEGVIRLQLFSAELLDGEWSDPVGLPFNNNEYSVGHASISHDNKWLYFASNMPGGFGGVDIYRAAINEDGTYGEAINLGKQINTEGDEMFPFIHSSNGLLFYASNGKVGLGGLDVFLAQIKDNLSIGKTMNLGAPINSSSDDFSFILDAEQKSGYFASNREDGKGSDDIYSYTLSKPFSFGKLIKGTAIDKNGNVLAETEVTLFDLLTGEEETYITNEDGTYSFMVEADKTFNLRGTKAKYFDGLNLADTHVEEDVIIADLELEKDPGLSLYALITAKKTGAPLSGVKIKLIDNMTGKVETYTTKESGDFLKPLVDKKLNERGSFNLELEKEGYLSKTVTYNTAFDREGKFEVHSILDLTLEKLELGGDLSKIIDINPIYFDLNKSFIRPDAALELDKIVKVMNENPNMEIELGSHTDSRGSVSSNESLSDRRAKASAQYVKERITNPERIYGKGYGESKPNTIDLSGEGGDENFILTEDYINSFKSKDRKKFDELHQMNRRTEFIIIKM